MNHKSPSFRDFPEFHGRLALEAGKPQSSPLSWAPATRSTSFSDVSLHPTKSSLTEGHPYYDAAPADDAYAGGLNLPLNTYTIPVQCDKNTTSSALTKFIIFHQGLFGQA